MATPSHDSDPKPVPNNNVVFIDTNLDTHLVDTVSDHDTVSDLKKKILSEHPLCFPKVGQIQIHAIKVKRKGYFYHLPDSMLVGSAFHGSSKSWFLSVDASMLGEHGQNKQLCSAGSPNQVACLTNTNTAKNKRKYKKERNKKGEVRDNMSKEKIVSDDDLLSFASKKVSSFNNFEVPQLENKQDEIKEISFVSLHDLEHTREKLVNNLEMGVKSSGNNDPAIPLPDSILKTQDHHCVNHELLPPQVGCEVDGSSKGVKDGTSISVSTAKKERKIKRQKQDMMQDDTSKENDVSTFGQSNNTVQQGIALITNPSENADKEVINETEVLKEHQHTECNNNDTTNVVTESIKETSEALHAAKHRKRKRSLTHDCEEMLKVETTSLKVEAQKSHEACLEKKVSKDQFNSDDDISWDGVKYKHDKVTEVVSDSKPPAKKRQKGKEKSGEKNLSNKKLSVISDFNVDNVSHQFLEVPQMIKNSNADQSEHLNESDPLRTSEHGGRRKVKKKSSNSYQKAVVTFSGKDDEADRPIIQGSVQGEISEDGQFSKGVSMSKTPLENMKIGIDSYKKGSPSQVKKTGNYKDHCDIDMKVHPSDVNEPKELPEDNVNFVLACNHKSEHYQIEGSEEAREALQQIDPKPMLVEECTPSNQDNADANIRGLNMTSKVDVNGMAEPVKSKNKKRKSKNSDGGPALREGISPIDASESEAIFIKSLKSINCDPASGNTETEENPLNHTTTPPTTTSWGMQIIQNNAGSMEQIATKDDAGQVDNRQRIKPSNTQNPALKSVSDVLTKDDVFDSKKPSSPSGSLVDASRSTKITKKRKSASTKSTNKSGKTNLDTSKHSAGLEHFDSQFMAASNGSSQFPSNTLKDSYNQENAAAKDSAHSPVKQDDNNLEEPLKTHTINADKQNLSQKLQHGPNMSDVLVDKMNGSDREDLDLMNGWNARKAEGTKEKTHAENLSSSQQLLSKDEHGVLKIHPDKKVPTVHETGRRAKLPSPFNSEISSIREKRKPKVNDSGKLVGSVKRGEGLPMSNSVLEGSKKMIQKKTGKASQNDVGKVVGKTQQKSLLAGAIFQDDSSGTSEYVHEADKSDASTRTPSDNSLVSDFSDSDNSAGSHGGKRLENGGRSALTESMSSARGVTIDHIFRSSSRYKKAKITASQLEGTESQPEFVQDSLADM